jgi:nucleoid-associated protein YgaU
MRKAVRFLVILLVIAIGGFSVYGLRSGWFGIGGLSEREAGAPGAPDAASRNTSAARPTFDVVRAEPDGSAVMAGRAEPGWSVIVESDGRELGRATADENGEWLIQPEERLGKGEHSLELSATSPSGDRTLFSTQRLALSLADPAAGQPLVALTEEGKATRVLQMPQEPSGASAAAPPPAQTASAGAPGLSPQAEEEAVAKIGFASVDYEDAGEKSMLHLSGHAEPGSKINLFVDNELIGSIMADATGSWSLSVNKELAGGDHALRADVLAAGDPRRVLVRAEVNFNRPSTAQLPLADDEAKIAALGDKPGPDGGFGLRRDIAPSAAAVGSVAAVGDQGKPRAIIVRRGDTLWQIAQRYYGDGAKYTQIFRNNRKQIRDPNWIYPNQRFDLPE